MGVLGEPLRKSRSGECATAGVREELRLSSSSDGISIRAEQVVRERRRWAWRTRRRHRAQRGRWRTAARARIVGTTTVVDRQVRVGSLALVDVLAGYVARHVSGRYDWVELAVLSSLMAFRRIEKFATVEQMLDLTSRILCTNEAAMLATNASALELLSVESWCERSSEAEAS